MLLTLHLIRKSAENKLTRPAEFYKLHHLGLDKINCMWWCNYIFIFTVISIFMPKIYNIYNLYIKNNKIYLHSLIITNKNYNN